MTVFNMITKSPEILARYITELLANIWNDEPYLRMNYRFDEFDKKKYSDTLTSIFNESADTDINQLKKIYIPTEEEYERNRKHLFRLWDSVSITDKDVVCKLESEVTENDT